MVKKIILLAVLALGAFSCSKSTSDPTGPGTQPTETYLAVINNLAETVSLIKTSDWSVVANAAGTGQVPNDADTMGGYLYVVNSTSSTLDRYSKGSAGIIHDGSVNLGSTVNPFSIDCEGSKAYVSCFMSNELIVVSSNPFEVKKRITVGKSPEGVLVSGQRAFVACTAFDNTNYSFGQGYVYVVSTTTDSVTDSIMVGKNPQYLARVGGEIHVACTGDWGVTANGRIYVIDPLSLTVQDSFLIEGTPGALSSAGGDSVYVAAGGWSGHGNVFLYRSSGEILRGQSNPILVPEGVMDVEYWNGSVFVASFGADSVVQLKGDSIVGRWAIGDGPQKIVAW
ncbi:hypothetical protein JXA84_02645 [candidate division WOR-3 bacterium]|nr:hypothetical protein [candidate division WOR-3 bacterium]